VKRLFALLFCFALILSQTVVVSGFEASSGAQKISRTKCCGHCDRCKSKSCCVGKDGQKTPWQVPAVPAHGLSQNDWQQLSVVRIEFLPETPPKSFALSSQLFFYPQLPAPLYQRNCSYLI